MIEAGWIQTFSKDCDDRFWRLYEAAPQAALDLAGSAFRYALPAIRIGIPITVYHGAAGRQDRAATMVTAGDDPWLGELVKRFFRGRPQATEAGRRPAWALSWALRQYESSADMIVARVDRLTSRVLFPRDYLAVPEWAGAEIQLPADPSVLFKGESVRSDLRRIKKYDLQCRISYDEGDFRRFYDEFHVPFVTRRHGEMTHVRSIHRLMRIFRRGGLIWVEQNGRPIAGTMFERRDGMIRMIVLGMKGDDAELMMQCAPSAAYYFSIQLAYAEKRSTVELGGVRPVLTDGVLKFKRKWGARLIDKRDIYHDYMVYINEQSEAARGFLSRMPLIYQDHVGLCGIAALGDDAKAKNPLGYPVCPGLRRLTVLGASSFGEAIAASLPAGTELTIR